MSAIVSILTTIAASANGMTTGYRHNPCPSKFGGLQCELEYYSHRHRNGDVTWESREEDQR